MPSSMNWVDGPGGGTPMSAANLDKLAVVADVATAGTPTGDALMAAYVAIPAGGADGNALVKSGSSVVWGTSSGGSTVTATDNGDGTVTLVAA